jgi:hypothetical protein
MIKLTSRQLLAIGVAAGAACCALLVGRGRSMAVPPTPYSSGRYAYRWVSVPTPTKARVSAWALYGGHQAASWALIYAAQRRPRPYSREAGALNVAALGVHAAFTLAHYIQTQRYYDALASDVPIISSQNAVIAMLILIHILENPRRGMAFGRPAPLPAELVRFLKRYHGYLFSLAIIYTFWQHPMEPRLGHLIGFMYAFMMMTQQALTYTDLHVNPYWTTALELMVVPHAIHAAMINRNDLLATFGFGLGAVYLITQMHGLGLPSWARTGLYAGYAAAVTLTYGRLRPPGRIYEIARVPALEYGCVALLALLAYLLRRLPRLKRLALAAPRSDML